MRLSIRGRTSAQAAGVLTLTVALGASALVDGARGATPAGSVLPAGVGTGAPGTGTSAPVVSDGRVWQLFGSLSPIGYVTLRSWPLRGAGPATSLRLAPVPARKVAPEPGTTEVYVGLPQETPAEFAVANGTAYVRGNVCAEDAPQQCDPSARTFVFDVTTGALVQAYPFASGPLVSSLQPGALLTSGSPVGLVLQNPVGNASYGPLQLKAANDAYAGPYTLRRPRPASHQVIDYRTGATRFTVTDREILRRAGQPRARVLPLALQPDGSLGVSIGPADLPSARADREYRRGAIPVYIDAGGRVRRVGPRLKGVREVSAVPSGGKVIVAADGGTRGAGRTRRAVCTGAWVTDRWGRRGYALSTERHAGKLRVAGRPVFWDGTTAIWGRAGYRRERADTYVVRQLGGLRLRTADRPSCRGTSPAARLSTEFDG
jgi:hypothetical protein